MSKIGTKKLKEVLKIFKNMTCEEYNKILKKEDNEMVLYQRIEEIVKGLTMKEIVDFVYNQAVLLEDYELNSENIENLNDEIKRLEELNKNMEAEIEELEDAVEKLDDEVFNIKHDYEKLLNSK